MSERSFTFLGTGTSVGVPMIGCECDVCVSEDPRNHRFRCAGLVRVPAGNILIDTPPELRLQLLRAKVAKIHGVLFTHYHADHLHGLDDLRPIQHHIGKPVPLYCTSEVEERIRTSFSYAFEERKPNQSGYLPKLEFRRIAEFPIPFLGESITPIPMEHGHFPVLGFRISNMAYCTDVSHIPDSSMRLLEGLDVLVLDALRETPHPAHFNLEQALAVIAKLKPKQTFLTHLSHEMDHKIIEPRLPKNIRFAYDGLSFDL